MKSFKRITESESLYRHLEKMSAEEILLNINQEDQKVAKAIKEQIPVITNLVEDCFDKLLSGGRLFYIGSGTSGRLGIVDASECPPTFGVPDNLVIGLIAGGDKAIRKAQEFAEDDADQGWYDLTSYDIGKSDFVLGIAASGTTPYVVGALRHCRKNGISTACITCNPGSPVTQYADFPIEIIVGPEFVTGSTRMKSGTAQKLTLNMISTALMIRLGRVEGNKMVDMQLSNNKLVERGIKLVQERLNCSQKEASDLLQRYGSVRKACNMKKTEAKT